MGTSGKHLTLGPGIYQDGSGITVIAWRGSGATRRTTQGRFPLGTPLDELRQARKNYGADLNAGAILAPGPRGLLEQDFDDYLATFPARSHRRRDEAALLVHWRRAGFGARARTDVQPIHIKRQLALFAEETKIVNGVTRPRFTPATINHLRRVLGAVYYAVNGRSGFNPVRDVRKKVVRYTEPRAIPYQLIEFIFGFFPDLGRAERGAARRSTINRAKLRYRVMAYTGLPPSQLGRIQPHDLNLRAGTVYGRPRRKGEGVDGAVLPLTPQGVREFTAFAAAQLFGPFSARSAAKSWRRAVTKAKAAWLTTHKTWPLPDDVRAYDLRHSFGTAVHALHGDLQATADLLMHASLTTTRRYTQAAASARMRGATDALGKLWAAELDSPTHPTHSTEKVQSSAKTLRKNAS